MASPTSSSTSPSPKRRRRWGWAILAGLLIAGGGAYAFLERPWETKPQKVAVETVQAGPITQVLAVNGRVAARQTVKIRSAVSGQALEILAEEGAEVRAGDVLIRIDPASAQAVVDQARAALDSGMVSQQQAQAAADRALALGENATRSTREDAELALVAATKEVARLNAAVEEATSRLAQYTITAPFDGVVLDRAVDQGQLVDTQSELFTIADLSDLLVETDVDELYSSRIKAGLKALLRPVGESVARHGTVDFANPTVDPATGGRAVKIGFDEPADLPVGLTVNANIIVSEVDSALSIPRRSIVTEGSESHLFVVENGLATQRPVEFSDWPAERVIVTEGLAEGDVVVLDPASIAPGTAVAAE
ncbi:MAG: efflux RND transporter periplasmic adaptor subunit [Phyllobacteriaceae bacterium]|nr:efflux RND transporter periplasmic adaptor subunit [Phyllobacteriaceae bacterium]